VTGASCQLVTEATRPSDREGQPDCFVELLECLADLRVQTDGRRRALSRLPSSEDPRILDAVLRLGEMQGELAAVAAKVTSVHQALQHEHLI
jgi:hypothetical protein